MKSCEASLCAMCPELEKEPFLPLLLALSQACLLLWAVLSSRLYLRRLVPWRELMLSGAESSLQTEPSRDMC